MGANLHIEIIDNSKEILSEFEQALKNAGWAIGATAEGHAKELCPVDTGRLRNSISHAESGDDIYIGTNVEYAPFVELGTVNQSPKYFLRDASTNYSDEYRAIVEDALKGE